MNEHQSDSNHPLDNNQDVDKTAGKVQPIKLTPEQIERRKQSEPTRDDKNNTEKKEGQRLDQTEESEQEG